jgi:hypothetical protein
MVDIASDTTILIAIVALIGTVIVALVNGIFSVASKAWLEPRRQRKLEHTRQQELAKALYNEVIHMCKFLLDKPKTIAAAPKSFFHLGVYYEVRKDPVKFFMLPTAHELDNFYMALILLGRELDAIHKQGKDNYQETINQALGNIAMDIVCSKECISWVVCTIKHFPSAQAQLLELLEKKQEEAFNNGLIHDKQDLRKLFGINPT